MIRKLLNSKKIRCGIGATVITVMFIIFVLLVNTFVSVVTDKFPGLNIDLTANRQFDISEATVEALKTVEKPVSMKLLLPGSEGEPMIEELLNRYKQIKDDIEITKLNIEKNPAIAQKYENVDPYGTLIIEIGDKYEAISVGAIYGNSGSMEKAEGLITNGIMAAYKGVKKTVYFSEGHGELPAYGIAQAAAKNYYEYDVLDITTKKIENCDMLVIFCPDTDFSQGEIALIESYVLNGGNLQIYLSPEHEYLPNLCEYIREWGVDVKNEVIVEKNQENVTQQKMFIAVKDDNDYTKNVKKNQYYTYAFKLDNLYSNTKGITLHQVLKSTDKATTLNQDGDTGNIGTHIISMFSERGLDDNSTVKMYVSGSSLLFENSDYMYNEEICQSVMMGILPSKNYVEIADKMTQDVKLLMTGTDLAFVAIVIFLLAIGILVSGIVVWSRRRKL